MESPHVNGATVISVVEKKTYEINSAFDPRSWTMFRNVTPSLLDRIRLFYVFGEHGRDAMFVTDADDVYAIGHMTFRERTATVGGVDAGKVLTLQPDRPTLVPELSRKRVVKFAYGTLPRLIALTEHGQVLSLGPRPESDGLESDLPAGLQRQVSGDGPDMDGLLEDGVSFQVGGRHSESGFPYVVGGKLAGRVVVDVAAGRDHAVALTDSGQLYSWYYGFDCLLNRYEPSQSGLPKLVFSHRFRYEPITAVTCGDRSVCALTRRGLIYTWGANDHGQLGEPDRPAADDTTIGQVRGIDARITQIASGHSHCVALTCDGDVFTWGNVYRSRYEPPSDDYTPWVAWEPRKVEFDGGDKFSEVAAVGDRHMSAARTPDGRVYVWGMGIASPTLTSFASLQEALAFYAQPSVTYRPIVVPSAASVGSLRRSFQYAFDDSTTTDVAFIVDGRRIHAHRTVMKIRCPYFKTMFDNQFRESSQSAIEIKNYSYAVYRAFLRYLYTDEVDLTTADELIELLDLANCYCETELKHLCERLVRRETTVDNVADIYLTAVKFQLTDLAEFCINFAGRKCHHISQIKEYGSPVDDAFRDFIAEATVRGVPT